MSGEDKEISFFKHSEVEEFEDTEEVKQDTPKIKKQKSFKKNNIFTYISMMASTIVIFLGLVLLYLVVSTTSANYDNTNKVLISELFSSDPNSSFTVLEENIFLSLQKKAINTKISFANDNFLSLETSHYAHINVINMGSSLYRLEYSNLSNAEYRWTNDYFQKDNLPGLNIQKIADPKNNEISVYISNAPIYLIGSTVTYPPVSKPQYPVISQSNDALPSLPIPPLPLPELKDNTTSSLDTPTSRLQEQMTELRNKSISDTMKDTPVYNQTLPKPIAPLALPPSMSDKNLNDIINKIGQAQKQGTDVNDAKNDFEKDIPQYTRQEQDAKTVTQLRQQLEKKLNTQMMEKIK